jgi:acetoin:2,6-dichlorophenolindophenol oxidoreductase subunit beta
MFGDFLALSMDSLINQASKYWFLTGGRQSVPLVIRSVVGAGGRFGAIHSQMPVSWLMGVPGLKLVAPSTPASAKGLLKAAIRDEDPVIIIEDSYFWGSSGPVDGGADDLIELGTAAVKRSGDDVTVVAIGRAVQFGLDAAAELEQEGIAVEVVDVRSLSPIDWATIFASVEKTGRLVVADCAMRTCGAAAEIVATVCEERHDALRAGVRRITAPDLHAPFSPALEKGMYPGAAEIAAAVRSISG